MLSSYADVLHRSWTESEGGCRLALETDLLHPLAAAALQGRGALPGAARQVLQGWWENRRNKEVEESLFRCVGW